MLWTPICDARVRYYILDARTRQDGRGWAELVDRKDRQCDLQQPPPTRKGFPVSADLGAIWGAGDLGINS